MIKEENEIVTNCDSFKFKAKDGKNYLTDTLDTKGILRLIESVSSPKIYGKKEVFQKILNIEYLQMK